ncbi:IclR family transcriptional regulator [Actinosynnema sp. NPDC047251]|uniref:Transcriptional regulator, IclR family n=1 Tax=Saccharothrix espanaensis (strain ATCC 51144 / DSM 44229 / JCM 9112 / NBRC 15066 / NRRL 15764) TaxID=1179773 RepID=K0K1L0_SACES|nr:IclR family transcriptional regulator [Saccharothrix espanaensis]CCH31457.1 Transcriptional regulator, IclR family [Saccharothrix espanaensis DSM 44229]
MAGGSTQPGRGVMAKALDVLSAFDGSRDGLPLGELSRRCGLPLSTTRRLAADLVAEEVLERLPDRRYVVGRRLWQLGLLARVQGDLRDVALPFLQDLYEATRENVHLAVRDGDAALYLERLHGRASVPLVSRPGGRLPLHATGVGKVLLAHSPPEVVAEVVAGAAKVTPYTITEPGRLVRELGEVRRRGYARTVQEMTLGTCSVAVPVVDAEGAVVASIGLVMATRKDPTRHLAPLRVAAGGISRALR